MNCKPGDLAVFVRSEAGNEGKIVRCVRFIGLRHWPIPDGQFIDDPSWEIDPPVLSSTGFLLDHAPDSFLRPIRDPGDDAQDETLQWLPVPVEGVPA